MKRLVLIIFLGSQLVIAQKENTKDNLTFGFNFELNRTNMSFSKSTLNNNAIIYDNYGFGLGLLVDYKLTNLISLAFKPSLNFSNAHVYFFDLSENYNTYNIMGTSMSYGLQVNIKTSLLKDSPYFIFGGQYKIPLYSKNEKSNSTLYKNLSTGLIDLGFGFNKQFKVLNFMPEIVYSFGLSNINGSPLLTSLFYNQFTLSLNFKS
jgi:hypothetical protein